jgi:catechol 2,3-dioxygenase-like lactoylglutathione lyase family enzyme
MPDVTTSLRSADICLAVSDVDRSVAFYGETLGFGLSGRNAAFAKFNVAGLSLALWHVEVMRKHAGHGVSLSSGASCFVGLSMQEPGDVDAMYDRLAARNVIFEEPPRDFPWGARCCFFRDPDAHLWEIYAWTSISGAGDERPSGRPASDPAPSPR